MRLLTAIGLLMLVGCQTSEMTGPARAYATSGLMQSAMEQIILTNGTIEIYEDVVYAGWGPVVTDGGQAVTCTLIVHGDIKSEPVIAPDCYDGAAVEILNPATTLVLVADTIWGHMRGIDVYGHLDLTATCVVGQRDAAISLESFGTAKIAANLWARGDTGYYSCEAGLGGSGIRAWNNNGLVVVRGDVTARWTYCAGAGVNSRIEVYGNLYYYGPNAPTNGDVEVFGTLTDMNAPVATRPGKRKGWIKRGLGGKN